MESKWMCVRVALRPSNTVLIGPRKALNTQEKVDKLDHVQMKDFCSSETL